MGTFSNDLNSCSRTRDEYLQEQQHEAEIKLLNEQKEEQNRQRQNELIQDKLRRERYSLFVNEIKSTLLKAASQGLYVDQNPKKIFGRIAYVYKNCSGWDSDINEIFLICEIYETVKKINFFNKVSYKYNSALKSNRVIAPVDYLQKERVERQYYLEKKELKRLGLSSQSSDSLFESNIKLCCYRTFEENYLSEFIKDNIDGFIIKSCFYDGYIIENNALYLNDPANWTVGYSGKCFDFEVDF